MTGESERFGLLGVGLSQGVVGKCARTNQAVLDFLTEEQFEHHAQYLIENWGFTEAEANKLSHDRRAYLAVPVALGSSQGYPGVIYMDSADATAFPPEVVDKIRSVVPFVEQLLLCKRDLNYG